MILIAHRGNLDGVNQNKENQPDYLVSAINKGFDVEIDVRVFKNKIFFGHDEAEYKIQIDWINKYISNCWFHAKNLESLLFFNNYQFNINKKINYFWHDQDSYTLTSQGFIWAYPGKKGGEKSIAVLPEINKTSIESFDGICSDFIAKYKLD